MRKKPKPRETEEHAYTLKDLQKFVSAVHKKFGKKALDFRIEVHTPFNVDGETLWSPQDLSSLSLVTYAADEDHAEEKVVVIR